MDKLKSLFEKEMPNYLYHYTNGNSFLGIIEKQEMWASHIRFMNDFKEEIHALDILENRLSSLLENTSLDSDKTIKLIKKYFDEEVSKLGIFILSFSENKDDLNQWRGYANQIPSYCLKFNMEKMKDIADIETDVNGVEQFINFGWSLNERKRKFFLLPCVYDEDEQNDLIDEIVNFVIKDSYEIKEDIVAQKIAKNLIFYSPLIKHKMSSSEHEWRIIVLYEKSYKSNFSKEDLQKKLTEEIDENAIERLEYEIDCHSDNENMIKEDNEFLKFRMGKSFIIPYYIFKLKKEYFDGFIIGACPDYNSVRESTIYFLSKNGFTYSEAKKMVSKTDNPYRNW